VTNSTEIEVRIEVGDVVLAGDLVTPEDAIGVVVFAHGSGSSRHSPRNRFVAKTLNGARIGTLLIDLVTRERRSTTGPRASSASTSPCSRTG
jgi:putative phosphoribosyl transferase